MKQVRRVRPELAPTEANVMRFVNMMADRARKLAAAQGIGLDDARQEIALMVMEALDTYEPRKGPLKYWVKLVVSCEVSTRTTREGCAKSRPWNWSYDQVEGWQRERSRVVSDLGVLDDLPEPEGDSPATPEEELLQRERRERFASAIMAAEAALVEQTPEASRGLAARIFRARVSEAMSSGNQKYDGLTEHLQKNLGVSRYVERRHWHIGRRLLERELKDRGER